MKAGHLLLSLPLFAGRAAIAVTTAAGTLVVSSVRNGPKEAVKDAAASGIRRLLPEVDLDAAPEGRMVDLPGRGRTFVVDVPGPTPDAQVVVLLHSLNTTAYLSWLTVVGQLSTHYRVVMLDQRWHGRGIREGRFKLDDCADDVAAVMDELGVGQAIMAGYSMGGAVAQTTWHRHPDRVSGLVLASTAATFRDTLGEKLFFPLIGFVSNPLSGFTLAKVEMLAAALPEIPFVEDPRDVLGWGFTEWRSISPWSVPEVLGELGRFDSRAWIGDVDVPAASVITLGDRAIPARRQRALAEAVHADVYEAPGGHASSFLDTRRWAPQFLDAVASVAGRIASAGRVAV